MTRKLKLALLPERLSICRLDPDAPIPDWAKGESFLSICRTTDELSIICPQRQVPPGVKRDDGWRCFKVEDTLDVAITGVLAALTMPLAFENISVFAISTFDTDYLLVPQKNMDKAITILDQNGHLIAFPQGEEGSAKLSDFRS